MPPLIMPELAPSTPLITEMVKGYRKFCCLRRTAGSISSNGAIHKLFEDKMVQTDSLTLSNTRRFRNLFKELIGTT